MAANSRRVGGETVAEMLSPRDMLIDALH